MAQEDEIQKPGGGDNNREQPAKTGQNAGNRNRRPRRNRSNSSGAKNTPREQNNTQAQPAQERQNNRPPAQASTGNNRPNRDPNRRRKQNPNNRGGQRGGNPVSTDQPARKEDPNNGERSLRQQTPRRTEDRQQSADRRAGGQADNRVRPGRDPRPARPRGAAPNRNGQQQNTSGQGRYRLDANSNIHVPSTPRRVRGGIKARSEEGEFGKNWWAKRWLLAMERLMDGARLQRGRKYARMGQVLSMNEANGGMLARVQGSRPAPYKVTIRVAPLTDGQWNKVYDVLADRAIFAAQLLAGEMPQNIEEAFAAADVSLFPARGGDLMTECSCPDWVNPCKHIAATHYILGDRFDEDPFLLLRMRGRSQDEILQALRLRRSGSEQVPRAQEIEQPEEEEISDLDGDLANFWQIGAELDSFEVNVQAPNISLPVLKRLGDPDFASKYDFEELLGPAYNAISQTALFLAFTDIPREERDNGDAG